MGRKKREISPKRAERLNIIIKREGITQTELSEKIYLSQQAISRILTMKNALTEDVAHDVINKIPS